MFVGLHGPNLRIRHAIHFSSVQLERMCDHNRAKAGSELQNGSWFFFDQPMHVCQVDIDRDHLRFFTLGQIIQDIVLLKIPIRAIYDRLSE